MIFIQLLYFLMLKISFDCRLMELAAAESHNNEDDVRDDDADYYRTEVGADSERGCRGN